MLDNFFTIAFLKNYFDSIENIFWLITIPLFSVLLLIQYTNHKKKLEKFFHPHVLQKIFYKKSRNKLIIKHCLFQLTIFFIIIAYMSPLWGLSEEKKHSGVDIVILIDLSNSMLVEDVSPNRLERAKLSIINFLESLTKHRVGIVVFSGSAFLLCPLTQDYATVRKFIKNINTKIISRQGTDLAVGLNTAIQAFPTESFNKSEKIILVFTDGENHNQSVFKQGEIAKEKKIKIFSIGIGTGNGEFIPIKNDNGKIINYLKNENGEPIVSKLDHKTLIELSQLTEGEYYFTEKGFLGIKKIYHKINSLANQQEPNLNQYLKKKQYQIFLLIAFFLLTLELLLTTNRFQFLDLKQGLQFFFRKNKKRK